MGTQESFGRIYRKKNTSWKTQKIMERCSGRVCKTAVEMQELEKIGRG
jgi:hypothetical protein